MICVSHLHSQMRGKLAGLVYMSSPFHPIVARQYVVPVNPNTTVQNQSRAAMSSAVNRWTQLDEEQRKAWREWAISAGYTKGGRAAFIRQWSFASYLTLRGQTTIPPFEDAPTLLWDPVAEVEVITPDLPSGQVGFTIQIINSAPVPMKFAIWSSPPFHASRYFWKGPWDTQSLNVVTVGNDDNDQFNVIVGNGSAGDAAFCRIVPYTALTAPYSGVLVGGETILRGICAVGAP